MGPPHQCPVEKGERAGSARGPSARAGLRAEFLGRSLHSNFFLFLLCKLNLCLTLYSKSCATPKIMEIFV